MGLGALENQALCSLGLTLEARILVLLLIPFMLFLIVQLSYRPLRHFRQI
jgi:hypothetical protein